MRTIPMYTLENGQHIIIVKMPLLCVCVCVCVCMCVFVPGLGYKLSSGFC